MKIRTPIVIMLVAAIVTIGSNILNKENNMRLKVSFPYKTDLNLYDPTKIQYNHEYSFLHNLYSTLIELNPKGGLESGIAEEYYWKGNEAVFVIRENLKSSSGRTITAEDVAFSFKRLLVQSGNLHGSLKDMLCIKELKSVNDECAGISISGNKVVLKTKQVMPSLFLSLAYLDFAIFPKDSIDSKTLKINDFSNTSGPYFVEKADNSHILLKANKNHYRYSDKIPSEIVFIHSDQNSGSSSLNDFKTGNVDYIGINDSAGIAEIYDFASKESGVSIHYTENIKSQVLIFTKSGRDKYPREERHAIGNLIRDAFLSYYSNRPYIKRSLELFSALSEVGLSEVESKKLDHYSSGAGMYDIKKPLQIQVLPTHQELYRKIFTAYNLNYELIVTDYLEDDVDSKETMPDMFMISLDTAWFEDIALISYVVNAGYFGLEKHDRSEWVNNLSKMLNKEERIKKIRELHFNALMEGLIMPLYNSPYVAMVRKPWKIEFSKFYALDPLWQISKN